MNKARTFLVWAGLLSLALLLPRFAVADWPTDPSVNVPVCTAVGDQSHSAIVRDGAGGAIVTWVDWRSNSNGDIYAQKISVGGAVQWTANGVVLCTATALPASPTITSDGAGGAIVAWGDGRGICAQRISAGGVVQWAANGVALCTIYSQNPPPTIISDGAGGAIATWTDQRGGNIDIYAQRISAGGVVQWTANGVALCKATGTQYDPAIASDGAGGAIVTWRDYRLWGRPSDIYAQRISAAGAAQWIADGVALCNASNYQGGQVITSDGAGGAIVAWDDERSGGDQAYVQRISAGGAVQWPVDGVPLGTASPASIVSDGAGGAIVATSGGQAQRISAAGAVQWGAGGVTLSTTGGRSMIVSDGAGGAVVAWEDSRNLTNSDIYAQRISAGGVAQWPVGGVALCTADSSQVDATIASDGGGGAIVAWQDYRNLTNPDIYAQRVQANGQLGGTVDVSGDAALAFALDPVRPNPSRGGMLTVRFTLPTAAPARLELLDVAGRRIASREVGSLGAGQHTLDLGAGQHLAPGLYLVRLTQGANKRTTRGAVLR